ncbi:Protein CBG01084 [Caenorhabditis briggsae]|uniref:Protein CBG01084 n=1 Tax=Caenorhabditis briggsae TaxID=6238 RepID=A8WPI7_CAEBR|nr:Protein CBG01084 [Caenorhabditis briggsae]CAP22394.2 Protein CBG01084 [Caenorhabditis briggsae]
MKKRRLESKKEEDLDEDLLPETGLYTDEGYLFYHTTPRNLTKAQAERAAKNDTFSERIEIGSTGDGHGLPHRSGFCIKTRAIKMMSDHFLKTFDWNAPDYAEQIYDRYYTYAAHDEITLRKIQKLLDKGYGYEHISELLDIPMQRAIDMGKKLRNGERREDREMLRTFYESCLTLGLDAEEIKKFVLDDNEFKLYGLREHVKIDQLNFRLKISEERCEELLKLVLKIILDKFREVREKDELEAELAWNVAIGEMSTSKPPIEEHQVLKALEIFCHKIDKDDTPVTMKKERKGAKKLNVEFFQNLRRGFRCQIKLHCLLWAWKRLAEWKKIHVAKGEKTFFEMMNSSCSDKNRYEAVLEAELANPLASDLTKKFLKNKKCVKWILESRLTSSKRATTARRLLQAAIEVFILYMDRKSGRNFKFPAKLHSLIATTPSDIIQKTLPNILDPENSEYLSLKKAKKTVETASGEKILVKLTSNQKAIHVKDSDDVEDSEEEGDDVDVERLLNYSRKIAPKIDEEMKMEIEAVLGKADPEKIRKKSKKSESLQMNEEVREERASLDRIARKIGKNRPVSREILETSDESDSDDVQATRARISFIGVPEDVTDSESEILKKEDSDDVTESEDVTNSESKKSRKKKNSEDFPEDVENSESKKSKKKTKKNPEDVTTSEGVPEDVPDSDSRKSKKKKDSEDVLDSEGINSNIRHSEDIPDDVEDSEPKKSRKKKEDSEVVPAPEDFPEDVEVSESKKTRKKKKDLVVVENSEDVPASEDNTDEESESRKSKKRKRRHSEDVNSDDVNDSEVKKSKKGPEDVADSESRKSKKKRKKNSEDVPVSGDSPEDVTDSESRKSKKKKKKKKKENLELPEDVEDLEVVKEKKKKKNRDLEDVE